MVGACVSSSHQPISRQLSQVQEWLLRSLLHSAPVFMEADVEQRKNIVTNERYEALLAVEDDPCEVAALGASVAERRRLFLLLALWNESVDWDEAITMCGMVVFGDEEALRPVLSGLEWMYNQSASEQQLSHAQ